MNERLPLGLAPMLASPGALPPDGTGWVYETKWDGVRALVAVTEGQVRLWSRAANDLTDQFPELAALAGPIGDRAVLLDGEVVAFGPEGTPSFNRIQQRLGLRRDAALRRTGDVPVLFVAFDVLHLDGRSTRDDPLERRRELLDGLELAGGACWHVSAQHSDGALLAEITRSAGLEGVVAKKLGTPYLPGVRTRTWLKVKHHRVDHFVVGGWVPGSGKRATSIGSLLVGSPASDDPSDRRLQWAGRVGTGFTERELQRLLGLLIPLATDASPFTTSVGEPAAVFVRPEVWVTVEYHEVTPDGLLRAPSYKGTVDPAG